MPLTAALRLIHFKRITENRAYLQFVNATILLRSKGLGEPFISHPKIQELELDYSRCTTSGFGLCGQGEYSGFIVTDGQLSYRVISIYIDVLSEEKTSIFGITDILREKDPEHDKCDIRKPIPMAILYYLEQFGKLPKKYT